MRTAVPDDCESGRDHDDAGDLVADGRGIVHVEVRGCRATAAATESLSRANLQDVHAQPGDLLAYRRRRPVAERHHRDDGSDADHDAQYGQERAQHVTPDFPQGEDQRGAEHAHGPRASLCCHEAVAHVRHRMRVGGHLGFVGDHEDGDSGPVETGQEFHDLERARRVEVAGRLVGEQHLRRSHDRARDGHALLLASREFGGSVIPPVGKTHLCQRVHCGCAPRARLLATVEQGQFDVLEGVGPGQQVEALEYEAEVPATQQRAFVAGQLFDVEALEQEFARSGHVEAAEDVHHRRLAGSRWTHDRNEVAGGDVEIHATQRLETRGTGAEGPGHAAQLDHGIAPAGACGTGVITHWCPPARACP